MKKLSVLLTIIMMLAGTAAWASGTNSAPDTTKGVKFIYGGQIDSQIAFYQKRLYLVDSEYKILSDIGKEAVKKISFLKTNRQKLIDRMIAKGVTRSTPKMNAFLGKTMNGAHLTTMEAYSE